MGIANKLFNVVDHVSNIIEAEGGKKIAYSIIHILVIIATIVDAYFFLEKLQNPTTPTDFVLLIVLGILGGGLLIESIFMVLYQIILFFANFGDFGDSTPTAVINIILTIIMAVIIILGLQKFF